MFLRSASSRTFSLYLLLLWGSACQSQPVYFSGDIEGLRRDSVYLFKWSAGTWEKAASAPISEGKFSFKGKITPGIYLWGFSAQEGDLVWLSEKEKPFVRGQVSELFQKYTYEQSPTNAFLYRFRREITTAYQAMNSPTAEARAMAQKQIDSLLQTAEKSEYPPGRVYAVLFRSPTLSPAEDKPASVWQKLITAFWEKLPWDLPYVAQLPETFTRFQAFWQNALALLPEDSLHTYAQAWIQGLPPGIRPSAWMALLDAAQRFQRSETMLMAAEAFLKVAPADPRKPQIEQFLAAEGTLRKGQLAPDIALPDPEGQVRRLSDLRGKWVLIDFWASWCRPCRMENPNVVRLYQKYHPKGFEIFGVSLDYNKEAWLQAIQKDQLTWTHVSDLKGWQSAGAQTYRVSGIPFTVLVDPEGRIAAKGLRGPSLEQRLKEIFHE
ncbi:MAG: AhpC/TSA family protein [Bacteroidia bacterium]|jgi:peroxiredoxin|nr:AhpC/TSA family protein [Bacteroidia bacterium]GIV24151.1 MAG: hypothetical protein KatS3mg025_1810 [Bacteroidia bacterium]